MSRQNSDLEVINFKKFPKLGLPLQNRSYLIYGKNRSGKTQILWAYLLFFRAFNLYVQTSITKQKQNINLKTEAGYLLNAALAELRHWDTFVTSLQQNENYGYAAFTGKLGKNDILNVKIQANGCLTIENNEFNGTLATKIAYAHMGNSYQFAAELLVRNSITSFDQSLRVKYAKLKEKNKSKINELLQRVFEDFDGIVESIPEGLDMPTSIFSVEKSNGNTYNIEIMVQSSSFQKVFAALILFFTLVEVKFNGNEPEDRYYLIDEPDALLDSESAKEFYSILLELSNAHSVKLIATTTNSSYLRGFDDSLPL